MRTNVGLNINEKAMNYLLLSLDDKQDFELCYQGLIAADDIIRNLGNENIILIPKLNPREYN